ncbi:MAG TPA: Tab2/Atab2 family RNA-binding protein [Leptolyngbyaceae cyanobacterium]
MTTWEIDFYRRPLRDEAGNVWWELLICNPNRTFSYEALCPQSQVNANWVVEQLQIAIAQHQTKPAKIQVFRPQSLSLIETAAEKLAIPVEATRRTLAVKAWLQERKYPQTSEPYHPLALDKPPPVPLPENLLGEQWRFATLPASDIGEFCDRPIPIVEIPEFLLPINLGIASTTPIPGVIIYGGRQSMRLAHWLAESQPFALNYIAGAPDGLILEAGLIDRWVVVTFEDKEVAASAKMYEQRKIPSKGLHFLLVQPDDSGMTYSGFWLLRGEN